MSSIVVTTPGQRVEIAGVRPGESLRDAQDRIAAARRAAARAEGKRVAGRRSHEYEDSSRVTVLVDGNPKRPGSKSAARFALYASSRTVGDYLGACAALQGGEPGRYQADIRWDTEKKLISLS